jgi:predicted outer membrane repeat protein
LANQSLKEASHLYSIFSTLTFTTCVFNDTDKGAAFDNQQVTGGFLYLSTGSTVSITQSQFIQGNATYGGAIYILGNADVSIKQGTFTENEADQGGAIYATSYNTFSITESTTFSGNKALSHVGECLYITNAFQILNIDSTTFTVADNAIYLKRTGISINLSTFTGTSTTLDKNYEYAGGIEFDEVAEGTINNCIFTKLVGKGGAIKIRSNPYFKQLNTNVNYMISNTNITNCTSVSHGGGIYIDVVKEVNLTNTIIMHNEAASGEGGGIYFI